ncbi:MAG: hypothetical protein Q7J59_01800 [Elusimicrobiota bacterium]|nr:hypothetical protein [Elusimicrobiota bacterium]
MRKIGYLLLLVPLVCLAQDAVTTTSPKHKEQLGKKENIQSSLNKVWEDEEGNVHYPPNYEYSPISRENYGQKYLAVMMFASSKTGKSYFKAIRIAKNFLSVPFLDEISPNFKNNIRSLFLSQIEKDIGKIKFREMWNAVESIKYVEGENVIYKNLRTNFKIKYPKNWRILNEIEHSRIEGSTLIIESPAIIGKNNREVFPSVSVSVKRISSKTAVRDFFQFWENVHEKQGCKFSGVVKYKKGLKSVFEAQSGNKSFKGEIVCFVENNFGYYLNLTAKPDVWKQAKKQFDKILDSFDIVKEQATNDKQSKRPTLPQETLESQESANFVSQALIAGGLDLSKGSDGKGTGVDNKGAIHYCEDLALNLIKYQDFGELILAKYDEDRLKSIRKADIVLFTDSKIEGITAHAAMVTESKDGKLKLTGHVGPQKDGSYSDYHLSSVSKFFPEIYKKMYVYYYSE